MLTNCLFKNILDKYFGISYPFEEVSFRRHELNAVQANFMKVSLSVIHVLRDSAEKTARVPSCMFTEKSHFVQPSVRLRGPLVYLPRPATADRGRRHCTLLTICRCKQKQMTLPLPSTYPPKISNIPTHFTFRCEQNKVS